MSIYTITVPELKAALEQNQPIELLDVRTIEKHQAFNIGGKHISLDDMPERYHELSKDKLIVTYCTTGNRSMRAVEYLLSLGFNQVKSLQGGMMAWQEMIFT